MWPQNKRERIAIVLSLIAILISAVANVLNAIAMNNVTRALSEINSR